ncbi:glycosyltransferase family 4 protein [Bradyrhizobium sp. NAS80.1]|uniref:glycosyltransferase family 4 protein n=1 Tax=Bradyrhizobium sp. NAS80.1 TaxID=1680159 RepID=UPI000AC20B35|nr:glycosyltransferase family 4 protein [Bradyrhizobium sp. NAS80.1]
MMVENLPVPFDRRVWAEARTLRAAGYEVTVVCPRGKFALEPAEVIDGIQIYRHPLPLEAAGKLAYVVEYGASLFWEFVYAFKVFRATGFDAIHACNPPDVLFVVGAVFKFLFGKKFVFDHHDLNPELFEAKFARRGILWRLLVLLERSTFAVADISIATNESYRRIAVTRGRMPANRVFTVRSGPDLDRARPRPVDEGWRNRRAHMAAYVGVIGEQEGVDLLLRSMDHIVRELGRRDVQLVIVGAGPQLDSVRQLSQNLGLSDYVTFTGRVDDDLLMTILSTADVCVNPDRPNPMNDMSTMNKVMEYMALGKPIVQFDLKEGRVSAQDSSLYARNTDVADFGEKILELVDNPDRRSAMGALGRKRVLSQLSWSHEAPKLLAAYDALFAPETELAPVRRLRGTNE